MKVLHPMYTNLFKTRKQPNRCKILAMRAPRNSWNKHTSEIKWHCFTSGLTYIDKNNTSQQYTFAILRKQYTLCLVFRVFSCFLSCNLHGSKTQRKQFYPPCCIMVLPNRVWPNISRLWWLCAPFEVIVAFILDRKRTVRYIQIRKRLYI